MHTSHLHGMSRRSFLHAGAIAGSGAALAVLSTANAASAASQAATAATGNEVAGVGVDNEVAGSSIARLQRMMASGDLSSRKLVDIYLRRIRVIDKGLDLSSVTRAEPGRPLNRRRARSRAP